MLGVVLTARVAMGNQAGVATGAPLGNMRLYHMKTTGDGRVDANALPDAATREVAGVEPIALPRAFHHFTASRADRTLFGRVV